MVDLFQISTSQDLEYGNLLLSCVSHFYILSCFQHQTRNDRKSYGFIFCSHGQNTTPEAIEGLDDLHTKPKSKNNKSLNECFIAKQKNMNVIPICKFQ